MTTTIPPFTVVIAVDLTHLSELSVSFPTWILHRAGLHGAPIIILRHPELDTEAGTRAINEATFGMVPSRNIINISDDYPRSPALHRQYMLSSFVFRAPQVVQTPYYLKLDTDALYAGGSDPWIQPEWFVDDPVIVAPPWGYTKPASHLATLDTWAETVPELAGLKPPSRTIEGEIAKSRRIISYAMFGRTDWTKQVTEMCNHRLPVPSQDTTLWYIAARRGDLFRRIRTPWMHIGNSNKRLRESANRILQGTKNEFA